VGDQGSGQIKVFDTGGNLLGVFGAPGSGAGQFTRLTGLAVDGGGYVYAADAFQSRVQIFNPDGTLREIFGNYGSGLGELMTPVGIAVSPASSRIVVASLNAARLEVYALQNAAPPLLNTAPHAGHARQPHQRTGPRPIFQRIVDGFQCLRSGSPVPAIHLPIVPDHRWNARPSEHVDRFRRQRHHRGGCHRLCSSIGSTCGA